MGPVEGVDKAGDLRILDVQPSLQDTPGSGEELAGAGRAIVRDLAHDEPQDALLIERGPPAPFEVELAGMYE